MQVYSRYLRWYLARADPGSFFRAQALTTPQALADFVTLALHVIEAYLHWEHHDRFAAQASTEHARAPLLVASGPPFSVYLYLFVRSLDFSRESDRKGSDKGWHGEIAP